MHPKHKYKQYETKDVSREALVGLSVWKDIKNQENFIKILQSLLKLRS